MEVTIDEEQAYAVTKYLKEQGSINMHVLFHKRSDYTQYNKMAALYLMRGDEEILFPDPAMLVEEGDRILFAGDLEAFEDLSYILENVYELAYVLQGKNDRSPLACPVAMNALDPKL